MIYSLIILSWLKFIADDPSLSLDFNHHVDWRTYESAHFFVHFEKRNEKSVSHLAKILEPIYDSLTSKFDSELKGKVHIVFSDKSDESNGLSTPIPYNTIYLYVAPPSDDSGLDYYDDWLKMLIAHELTHTVHLNQRNGIHKWLSYIFGTIVVPNAIQQQWGLEGLAQLEETRETTKGRGRSPLVASMIRTSALEKNFLPIDRATYWNGSYPYGGGAYIYGIGFYEFLVRKFGEQKIYDFTRLTSESIVPGFLNFKTAKIFGTSFSRLWKQWQEEEEREAVAIAPYFEEPSKVINIESAGKRIEGLPTWDDRFKTLYAVVVDPDQGRMLIKYVFSESDVPQAEVLQKKFSGTSLSRSHNQLFYSKNSFVSRSQSSKDIWTFDLDSKQEKRITRGLRLRDPIERDGILYAVKIDDLKSEIISFKSSEPPETTMKVIYSAPGFDHIAKPALSPSGQTMAFTLRQADQRKLCILDLKTGVTRKVSAENLTDVYDPSFLSDNQILFSGYIDRTVGENKKISTSQIFVLNLETNEMRQLTQSIKGYSWPRGTDKMIAVGQYSSTGFRPQVIHLSEKNFGTQRFTVETLPAEQPDLPSIASQPYSIGSTLLPHFLLPFFYYTESDMAIGALTKSQDPLQTWSWAGSVFHHTAPQRPGGGIQISYHGLDTIDLFVAGSAGISDYGRVLATVSGGQIGGILADHYYERSYNASAGYTYQPADADGLSAFDFSQSLFYQKRHSLLDLPAGIAKGVRDITVATNTTTKTYRGVALGPEEGYEWGLSSTANYRGPISGQVSVDLSPSWPDSAMSQLVTTLSLKGFFNTWENQKFAAHIAAGIQWLDPLYQRTFRLGGSFGESPFVSVNKQLYSLRGLEASYFRGEGITQGSVEYRWSFFKDIPGFGTAPIWIRDMSSTLFADTGQTFKWRDGLNLLEVLGGQESNSFSWKHFTVSAGLELQSNVSLIYGPPLLFRVGYGHILLLDGKWKGADQISQTYFSAGASF